MPRKSTKTAEERALEAGAKTYDFIGGPRDGTGLRMVYPPVPAVRFGFPEWAVYVYDEELKVYRYDGDYELRSWHVQPES